MTLELCQFAVRELSFDNGTEFIDGRLTVDDDVLCKHLAEQDERIQRVQVALAKLGDPTRIVCVKDAVEPRRKVSGNQPGEGRLHALKNLAVVTCGPIVGFQEGVIDMSGPGADYTPFSGMNLVVLQIEVDDGLDPHEHEETVRLAGLRAAEYVAQATETTAPDSSETLTWNETAVEESLPRIAYLYMLLSQGLLHDTYVLGRNAKDGLPRLVDPRAAIDTGIVSGNCVSACDKNTTWHHQNNPLIAELLAGHGTGWNFAGVILTNEPTRLSEKEQSARAAVELARQLNVDGVVVSKEGFGNPDADLMMILRGLEQAGIKTTAVTDEYAGVDGGSQSLADTTPEADAIVSTGNANERLVLPAMARTIGPLPDASRLAGGYPHSLRDDGSLEVELQAIIGATNQLGHGRLSCREV